MTTRHGRASYDYRRLEVWRKAHALVLDVYKLTEAFPAREKYGLASQMRASASSVPTNIAEGCGRGTQTELSRFLQIARGSATELEYQLLLARDLSLISLEQYDQLSERQNEIARMLTGLREKTRTTKEGAVLDGDPGEENLV